MIILSADPGVSGAVCCYNAGSISVHDMPTVKREIGGKVRRALDEVAVVALFRAYADIGATALFIEQVGGLPGQSAVRAFNFGWGYGVLRTAALAAGVAVNAIPPATWKRAMRAPQDKMASIARANELLPGYAPLWGSGTGDQAQRSGRAEAAMLALYGERVVKGLENV